MVFCVKDTLYENINCICVTSNPAASFLAVLKNDPKARQHFSSVLQGKKLPLKFVPFVLQLFHFIVCEEISNVRDKISIDTIHVTWRGYNSIHIFVTIMNAFFYLGKTETLKIMLRNSRQSYLKRRTHCFKIFIF